MSNVVAIDTCSVINLKNINKFWVLEQLKYSCLTTVFVQLEFEKGYEESRIFFEALLNSQKIDRIALEIDDLITMAHLPKSKRASDAELSCFIVSQRLGCKTMTDDKKAIKFALNNLSMDKNQVIMLSDLLFEAYNCFILSDNDLREIQKVLAAHKFIINYDLACEAARRRIMNCAQIS